MRTMKQYIEAAKARKENGEEGFSLVELIVVVVILGVLAAVAIPIFNGIQEKAAENAAKAAVANFASEGVAKIAMGETYTVAASHPDFADWAFEATGTSQVDTLCITGTKGTTVFSSGPGC